MTNPKLWNHQQPQNSFFDDQAQSVIESGTPRCEHSLMPPHHTTLPHQFGTESFGGHSKAIWSSLGQMYQCCMCLVYQHIFHHLFCLLQSIPRLEGCPQWVEPCLERIDLPYLQNNIPDKYSDWIPCAKKEELRVFCRTYVTLKRYVPK